MSESRGELLVADSQSSPSLCRTVAEVSVPCQRAMQVAHFVASSEGWRQDRHGCQSQLADCRRPSESVPFQPSMICCTSYLAKLCAEGESASRADCKRHDRRHPISAISARTRFFVESYNPISRTESRRSPPSQVGHEHQSLGFDAECARTCLRAVDGLLERIVRVRQRILPERGGDVDLSCREPVSGGKDMDAQEFLYLVE